MGITPMAPVLTGRTSYLQGKLTPRLGSMAKVYMQPSLSGYPVVSWWCSDVAD